jgi:acylphosphatase
VFMQGPEEKVNSLLSWCYQGPAGASVATVDYMERPVDPSISTFNIKY